MPAISRAGRRSSSLSIAGNSTLWQPGNTSEATANSLPRSSSYCALQSSGRSGQLHDRGGVDIGVGAQYGVANVCPQSHLRTDAVAINCTKASVKASLQRIASSPELASVQRDNRIASHELPIVMDAFHSKRVQVSRSQNLKELEKYIRRRVRTHTDAASSRADCDSGSEADTDSTIAPNHSEEDWALQSFHSSSGPRGFSGLLSLDH